MSIPRHPPRVAPFARPFSPFLPPSKEGRDEDGSFDYFPDTDNATSPPPPPNPPIAFVQSETLYTPFNNSASPQEFEPTTPPTQGNDLLVWVASQDDQFVDPPATLTVTNGNGDAYTQVGSYAQMTKVSTITRISLWRKKATDGADDNSYIVTPNQAVSVATMFAEYEGFAASPNDGTAFTTDGDAATMEAGPITVTGLGQLVTACFISSFVVDTVTPGTGYTLLESIDGSAGDLDIVMYLVHELNVDGPATPTVDATWDGGADDYAAVGASFKD